MTTHDDRVFEAIRRRTRPTADAVHRVRTSVQADSERAEGLLQAIPGAAPGAAARVARCLRSPATRTPSPLWLGVPALAVAALAWLWMPPGDLEPRDLGPSEALALTRHVDLEAEGRGHVTGSPAQPRIRWDRGTLTTEVTPKQGIELQVATDEALVTVLGTRFDVTRDALGTTVSVARGRVRVACTDGPTSLLEAGATTTCLPVRPGALLGRATALIRTGAPAAEIDDALRRGLASAEGPIRGALLALQLDRALRADDVPTALKLARTYVTEGHAARQDEIGARLQDLERRVRCEAGDLDACPGASP